MRRLPFVTTNQCIGRFVVGAMWYNSRPMLRRGLTVTLLAIIAVQLLGAMAFASVCLEPCPDDGDGQTCPPVCTSCTRAQQAILDAMVIGAPEVAAQNILPFQFSASPTTREDDIFHVPLLG
jgi:hypothetical protein